jgi:hypothetical protein
MGYGDRSHIGMGYGDRSHIAHIRIPVDPNYQLVAASEKCEIFVWGQYLFGVRVIFI